MLRILAAIVALCAIGAFAGFVVFKDDAHWRDGDRRHASRGAFRGAFIALVVCCIAIGVCICGAVSAHARTSPYPGVTPFNGDRYGSAQLGPEVADSVRRQRAAKARKATRTRRYVPLRKPRPGSVDQISLYGGMKREAIEAAPTRWLAGVVAPLAAKAREIVADCGSKVISGVRHTYIAGTGGRLSLHASGRAVDIKGNPACIMAHVRNWPGGVSIDYAAVNHTHISYAPNGPEWGARFAHYRGGHRHKHRHRRRA